MARPHCEHFDHLEKRATRLGISPGTSQNVYARGGVRALRVLVADRVIGGTHRSTSQKPQYAGGSKISHPIPTQEPAPAISGKIKGANTVRADSEVDTLLAQLGEVVITNNPNDNLPTAKLVGDWEIYEHREWREPCGISSDPKTAKKTLLYRLENAEQIKGPGNIEYKWDGEKFIEISQTNGQEKIPTTPTLQLDQVFDEKPTLEMLIERALLKFGDIGINGNSLGFASSGNETTDARFSPDVRDHKGSPYMGFGNSPGDAKLDLLCRISRGDAQCENGFSGSGAEEFLKPFGIIVYHMSGGGHSASLNNGSQLCDMSGNVIVPVVTALDRWAVWRDLMGKISKTRVFYWSKQDGKSYWLWDGAKIVKLGTWHPG